MQSAVTTKVLQIPEAIPEVAICKYKITLIYQKTGRKIVLVGDPVIENGVVIGYTGECLRPLQWII